MDPCVDCGGDLVVLTRWRVLPESYRRALRIHGVGPHQGRGLCAGCHIHRSRLNALVDAERLTLSRDELLDEWLFFTKDRDTYTQNVKAFAEYLGRSYKGVERALNRAGVGPTQTQGVSA
jgi:hypothetical protein